jgi:hypothetical protein
MHSRTLAAALVAPCSSMLRLNAHPLQIEDGVNYTCPVYENAVIIDKYIRSVELAHVYWNCNVLANNGVGACAIKLPFLWPWPVLTPSAGIVEALLQIRRDTGHYAAALENLNQKTGGRYRTPIDHAMRAGGATGSHYILEANEWAVKLCETVVGVVNPFDIPRQTDIEICRRLECKEVTTYTPKKKTKKTEQHLSAAMKKRVLDAYFSWVNVDKSRHKQRTSPSDGRSMTMQKAMNLLNHVLGKMYDVQYSRNGVNTMVDGVRIHEYALNPSSYFHRRETAFDVLDRAQSKRPCIQSWLRQPLQDLLTWQLVGVDLKNRIVQPGTLYAKRQGDTTCRCNVYELDESVIDFEAADDMQQRKRRWERDMIEGPAAKRAKNE